MPKIPPTRIVIIILLLLFFFFRTDWGSIEPATRLYAETLVLDMPFMGMDTDACKYTNCPVVEQATQTWQYTLFILDSYPKGSYTVKMKLWDNTSGASSAHECCFKLDIKIVWRKSKFLLPPRMLNNACRNNNNPYARNYHIIYVLLSL